MKHFLEITDFSAEEIVLILDRADALQEKWKNNLMPQSLKHKTIALWFYGHGFRNRMAFEIGAKSMGADVSFVPGELGVHEPIEDIAHYLNNWFSMLVIRCKSFDELKRIEIDSKIPLVNARTSQNHPCEIIGDLQYIRKKRKTLNGLRVIFVGETTNLCTSCFEAAKVLPIHVLQIGPKEYLPTAQKIALLNKDAKGKIEISDVFEENIGNTVDVLYTDCWPSDQDKVKIRNSFLPYQITGKTVDKIHPNGFFMPCPPVTRGQEISADALANDRCCDYEAKEYLLHAQNAIMEYCLAEKEF